MSKERLEELAYNVGISLDGEKALMSSEDYDFLYNHAKEQAEQNKRYREAREIIEQVYKENYVRNANAYGYEDGYLDGLDTAIDIIDKALEESE